MGWCARDFKPVVTAFAVAVWISGPAGPVHAELSRMDDLFNQLATAESADAGARVAAAISTEWSKSGSPAIDLLLSRGRDALEAGENGAAVEHLTAAIDFAPDFAEAYHLRATAYYHLDLIGPALADLGRALELEPRHFGAMQGIGVLLEQMDRPERALDVFRAVLAIHPTDPDIAQAVERLTRQIEGDAI